MKSVKRQVSEKGRTKVWWQFGHQGMDQVDAQVGTHVSRTVMDQVGSQVYAQVRRQVWEDFVDYRNLTKDNTYKNKGKQ